MTNLYFDPDRARRDIHLLPGLASPRLDHLLWIETTDPANVARADSPPAGITVKFQALFIDAPKAHGVTLNEDTGEITVDASWTAGTRLRSFVVLCGASEPQNIFSRRIRVYIHERMDRMWLSPYSATTHQGSLTVRKGTQTMRFSVMAEFDDEVVGDITNWSPFHPPEPADRTFVRAAGSAVPVLDWSSSRGDVVDVNPKTGVLTGNAFAAIPNPTITARWPPPPAAATKVASGTAICAPAWNAGVRLTRVGQGPGFAGMDDEDVHNLLFLPDGFADTPADQAAFRRFVRDIVSSLTYHPRTRPFDLFAGNFNYFLAWVPSPDAGISVLNELDRLPPGGPGAAARPIPPPTPPPGQPDQPPQRLWELMEIVNEVGLPAPKVDTPGSPLGTATAGRLHDWIELYGREVADGLVDANGVVNPNYTDWLDLSDRVVLNERDTAFHVAMGERPAIEPVTVDRGLQFNDLRMADDDLDLFLGALEDDHGDSIPRVWVSGGKDDDLVVILCRSNRIGGSNAGRGAGGHYLAVTLDKDGFHHVVDNPDGNGFDVDPDVVPRTVPLETWITVAHELAHSWGLNDEYGGFGLIDLNSAAELGAYGNAQPRSELLAGVGANLETVDLKWRWPRIVKAGVLAQAVDDTSHTGAGPFRLRLKRHHGDPFGRGDVIRLRTRPLLDPAIKVSDRLKISRMLGDGDELEAVLPPGSTLTVGDFPVGSVVMAPRREPDPDPAHDVYGDDLELVHKSVRDRIDLTNNPLNAAAGDPPNRPCPGTADTPTGATNFPGGAPKPPRYSSWIVGLYENARQFDCEVYRPTGVCIMRQNLYLDRKDGRERAYQFCPVCRYVMVDLIDPSKHGAIDRDYHPRYPK